MKPVDPNGEQGQRHRGSTAVLPATHSSTPWSSGARGGSARACA